ncbi:GNAT family N-acetyltransferase [Planctomonas psychrotolerans]|uniref:GNAT family N-acetyltransferase n=1 Tax=Planctomonas psychrotolerans TaxID=2528712 RepID=UPI001239C96F|nr:GNAT family N-acetyltransferase [Planctomonas psychrotolerans]
MPAFRIDELAIPDSMDTPGSGDFAEMVHVRNAIEAAAYGTDAFAYSPAELLPAYQLQEYEPKRVFVARVDGRIVGRAVVEWSPEEDDRTTWAVAEVLPDHRRRGVGAGLLDLIEAMHAESGRTSIQGYVPHAMSDSGERLVPPTGFGSVPADDPGVRFLLAHGYSFEQVARASSIPLPVHPATLAGLRADAEAHSGADYRVVRWLGGTPDEWVADMAALYTAMSTADPHAGLDTTEDRWDEDRLRKYEAKLLASGRLYLTAAAVHVASGRLAGYTELSVPTDRTRPTSQEDTLVLEEHRGHRLGMLLKAANLEFLAAEVPETPMVFTFNAEENRPMLSVNEAVGFIPIGHEGAWKKVTR